MCRRTQQQFRERQCDRGAGVDELAHFRSFQLVGCSPLRSINRRECMDPV
jgi:hypothetical protein